MLKKLFLIALLPVLFVGCLGYHRGSGTPVKYRTLFIPSFENATNYPMAGAIASQQCLDAIIEDGTFYSTTAAKARLQLNVTVDSINSSAVSYDRNHAILPDEYHVTMMATLYVFDRSNGKTLIAGAPVKAVSSMLTRNDFQSGLIDAMPRLGKELGHQILLQLHSIQDDDAAANDVAEPADGKESKE